MMNIQVDLFLKMTYLLGHVYIIGRYIQIIHSFLIEYLRSVDRKRIINTEKVADQLM